MPQRLIDITGQRFGRLLALEHLGSGLWRCRCDCGNEKKLRGGTLRSGNTTSCGCLHREMLFKRNTGVRPEPLSLPARTGYAKRKPRQRRTPARIATYHSWYAMISRCRDQQNPAWANYGGRGIGVCAEWEDFETFLADMGEKPPGFTLDRIDNSGDYGPDNCRWATPRQQARNTRRFKLTPELVREIIRLDAAGMRVGDIARQVKYMPNGVGIVLATAAALGQLSNPGQLGAQPGVFGEHLLQ